MWIPILAVGAVVAAGALSPSPPAVATTYSQQWYVRDKMRVPRRGHIAAGLPDGTVLVAGGVGGSWLKSAEIYDPVADEWTDVPPMSTPRYLATATSLKNGDVLVIGGCGTSCNPGADLATAERYDWVNRKWYNAGSMSVTRSRYHTATTLADGRVLVVAGVSGYNTFLASAEIWNNGMWSAAGELNGPRQLHSATLLVNGNVLVVGGVGLPGQPPIGSTEIYIPSGNAWTQGPELKTPRWGHAAASIPGSGVLVTGGFGGLPAGELIASSEVFNLPGSWSSGPALNDPRGGHRVVTMDDGTLLVAGGCAVGAGSCGFDVGDIRTSVERFDPSAGHWDLVDALSAPRHNVTLTALPGQRALVAGGVFPANQALDLTELYTTPPDTTPPDTAIVSAIDGNGSAVASGGSTVSDVLTVEFAGTDNVGVVGFQCSADGASFKDCSSPVALTGLIAGAHTFEVRARDSAGNIDPTPATWTWTVLTPVEAIEALIATIDSWSLKNGVATSLTAPLKSALISLTNGSPLTPACNKLNAFMKEVDSKLKAAGLNLTQAAYLNAQVQAIMSALGC